MIAGASPPCAVIAATAAGRIWNSPFWNGAQTDGNPSGIVLEEFTSFYCPEGTVNDYALLFFQPSEDTIKMLFHSEQGQPERHTHTHMPLHRHDDLLLRPA